MVKGFGSFEVFRTKPWYTVNRNKVAEGEGFEPPEPLLVQRFSRPPHSTTLPPFRKEWELNRFGPKRQNTKSLVELPGHQENTPKGLNLYLLRLTPFAFPFDPFCLPRRLPERFSSGSHGACGWLVSRRSWRFLAQRRPEPAFRVSSIQVDDGLPDRLPGLPP